MGDVPSPSPSPASMAHVPDSRSPPGDPHVPTQAITRPQAQLGQLEAHPAALGLEAPPPRARARTRVMERSVWPPAQTALHTLPFAGSAPQATASL